jgi:hypothetical protein
LFHIAREYTEKWHHQQQIREAVNQPDLLDKELFHPVLNTFMYALPHSYRDIEAEDGAAIEIEIAGGAGGAWFVQYTSNKWKLSSAITNPSAVVHMTGETAWKLFTKGLSTAEADDLVQISGDFRLGQRMRSVLGVMA